MKRLLLALLVTGAPYAAHAQTGVSDDRVSLPEGPGSLGGVGDDAGSSSNMGMMSYVIGVEVPAGFAGMTPALALSYASGSGSGIVGLGWTLPVPAIERLTVRGVPQYDADDELSGPGGEQLVLVEVRANGDRVYRARFEGGFVRYTWKSPGAAGYLVAEYPDGRVATFGADDDGQSVDAARVGFDDGGEHVFRWGLVKMVDVWGHAVDYTWTRSGSTALLTRIEWVDARYAVELSYEARADALTVANGGFEEVLDQRLAGIVVSVDGAQLRRYALVYEDAVASGGLSRLSGVQLYGVGDLAFPVRSTFGYAQSIGATCDGSECRGPVAVTMNAGATALGLNLRNRDAQLVDMNGDGLPDLVDSAIGGAAHRIFLNTMAADGTNRFVAAADSAVGREDQFDFSSPWVQMIDANGDGFTDAVNADSGAILYNGGDGDWDRVVDAFGAQASGLPSLEGDFDDSAGELKTLRFMDFDNDRRIDVIKSSGTGGSNITTFYRNTADGFVPHPALATEPLGLGFETRKLELNDINGDGLLDGVQVDASEVTFRLSLGWGKWSAAWERAAAVSFTAQQTTDAELEDINGDGLADLVLVTTDSIRLWLNRTGREMGDELTFTDADVDGGLPIKGTNDTVLFADMNGNGSSDVVYVTTTGEVSYVDLFPVRPNLLTSIDNGLGRVTTITYGTSVQHMARDAASSDPWQYRLPFPNVVVDAIDTYDVVHALHRVEAFAYHDGYFDRVEKQFRGYAAIDQTQAGNAHQADAEARMSFDVGVTDPCFAGKLVARENLSGGASLQLTRETWAACDVAEADSLGAFDVCFACKSEVAVELREGQPETDWITTRTRFDYDGYGNVVRTREDGVVDTTGDERVTEATFVPPTHTAGRWILNKLASETSFASEDGASSRMTRFYDGQPAGQLTHGFVSEVRAAVTDDAEEIVSRQVRDAHGNSVDEVDALGTPDGDTHRVKTTMSADGLRVTKTEVLLSDADGPYVLTREVRYDALFDKPSLASAWFVVRDGDTLTDKVNTSWSYDAFGRLTGIVEPGDTAAAPTSTYSYEVGAPSTITARYRSVAGATPDIEKVTCVDGKGRPFQTKTKVGATWQVEDRRAFSPAGDEVVRYASYQTADGGCADAVPNDVAKTEKRLDAVGRITSATLPDGGEVATEYGPLWARNIDANDHMIVTREDGLQRVTSVERIGDTTEVFTMTYDDLGGVASVTDPTGATRTQEFDRRGRITRIDDPDRGVVTKTYDAVGKVIKESDATGSVERSYDSMGRLTAQWVTGDESSKITYAYDLPHGRAECTTNAGLLTSVSYPTPWGPGRDTHVRDARQRPTRMLRAVGDVALHIDTTYDNAGRVTGYVYPGDRGVSWTTDAGGSITAIAGYVDSISENVRGEVASVAYANGVTTAQTFDRMGRIATLDVSGPSGALLAYTYTRDPKGLIATIDDRADHGGSAMYTHDAFDRLIEAALDVGGSAEEIITYAYDAADNIVSRESSDADSPEHDTLREHDGRRVTRVDDVAVSYDAAGKVTTRGAMAITWDGFDRVIATDDGATSTEAVYGRDADRIYQRSDDVRTWSLGPDFMIEDGVAIVHVKLGDQTIARHEYVAATLVLADQNDDDQIDVADAWLASQAGHADVDAVLASSARQGVIDRDEAITWLHRDHLDSLALATDEAGAVVERTLHYPFGAVRQTTTNDPEALSFTDARSNHASGLVQLPLRDYDPALGRWLRPDALFESMTADNVTEPWKVLANYAYVSNGPTTARDPTGADDDPVEWHQVATAVDVFNNYYSEYYRPPGPRSLAIAASEVQAAKGSESEQTLSGVLRFVYWNRKAIFKGLKAAHPPQFNGEANVKVESFKYACQHYFDLPGRIDKPNVSNVATFTLPKDPVPQLSDPNFAANLSVSVLESDYEADMLLLDIERDFNQANPSGDTRLRQNARVSNDDQSGSEQNVQSNNAVQSGQVQNVARQRAKPAFWKRIKLPRFGK